MDGDEEEVTAPLSVWIGLILIAAVSFWCQATVTEERFVPALNVIATEFGIPDDIAGATLMAAGASSPELFSSLVSLFITHSSLGLGTIVGSEIFNQLVICAGAVHAAKSGQLQLDRAVVTREVGFYALSILLLYLALQDTRPDPDDPSGEDHIYISFGESFLLVAGYVLYVVVCANMDAVVKFCSRFLPSKAEPMSKTMTTTYGATSTGVSQRVDLDFVDKEKIPFLREKSTLAGIKEPAGNFVELSRTKSGDRHSKAHAPADQSRSAEPGSSSASGRSSGRSSSLLESTLSRYSDTSFLRSFEFLVNTDRPSDEHELHDVEINTLEDRLSCFLWQRSYFYSKARFATHGWHLRWFTLCGDGRMYSVPNRVDSQRHVIHYPAFREMEIDVQRLIMRLVHPVQGKRSFYLMAPSEEIFWAVVTKMEGMIEKSTQKHDQATDIQLEVENAEIEKDFEDGDDHVGLIDFPVGGSNLDILLFLALFPLRLLMQLTVPDVRHLDKDGNPVGSLNHAFLSAFSCLLWLIVGSYAMVASLEDLAELMDIPDAVIGVTVSAAGTSLPNYVASKVAAQNGFGNMAVSNAFGSNTFNIMIGLGLPWALYTSFGTGFQDYHGLRDEGITESVVILASVLLVFVVLVIHSGFVLYKWHSVLFVVLYVSYLVYAIGRVYI